MTTIAKTNHQNALDYCMYMMLASNFQRSHLRTPLHEKKLYLYYKEEKETDQVQMEQQCLSYIQKIEQKLQSKNYVVYVKTEYSKRNPKIHLKLWTRREVA